MSEKNQLKANIEARRDALQRRLTKLGRDVRDGTNDERARIERKLAELGETLADGWDNLTESAARRLNAWLGDDEPKQAAP